MFSRWLAAGALLATSLFVHSARADTEPIRIEYRAPSDCPNGDAFNAEVFRRTSSARLVATGDQVRTFVVVLEQRRGLVAGSLRVREAGSETVAREVQGERCAEVASALALATALAIDPNAAQSAAPPPSKDGGNASTDTRAGDTRNGSGDSRSSDGKNTDGRSGDSRNRSSSDKTPDGSTSVPGDYDTNLPPMASDGPSTRRVAFALGPSLLTSVTPRVALGGSLSLSSDDSSPGVWPSSLGVEISLLRGLTSETNGAHSTFQLVHARPSICAPGVGSREAVWLIPCLGADLGAISGWGSDIDHEESQTKAWAALDALLRLRVAQQGWFLQAEAGLVLPLTRYDFVFLDPNTPIHSVPSAAFSAGLRVGMPLSR